MVCCCEGGAGIGRCSEGVGGEGEHVGALFEALSWCFVVQVAFLRIAFSSLIPSDL